MHVVAPKRTDSNAETRWHFGQSSFFFKCLSFLWTFWHQSHKPGQWHSILKPFCLFLISIKYCEACMWRIRKWKKPTIPSIGVVSDFSPDQLPTKLDATARTWQRRVDGRMLDGVYVLPWHFPRVLVEAGVCEAITPSYLTFNVVSTPHSPTSPPLLLSVSNTMCCCFKNVSDNFFHTLTKRSSQSLSFSFA